MNLSKYDEIIRQLGIENNLIVDPTAYIWQLSVENKQSGNLKCFTADAIF